jgi:recombination protein RecT
MNALTAGLDLNEFITCAWIQVQSDERIAGLAKAYPERVFKAMLQAARMGVYLDGVSGDGYLVVYGKEVAKQTCVAMRGYKNYMRLFAENNPDAAAMPVVFDEVREGDEFDFQRGADPFIHHKYGKDRGDVTHYYAAARFKDGTCWPKVMTIAEVDAFKKYAKTMDFWDSPHENTRKWMRIKTVVRQLFKEVPIPRAARRMLDEDEGLANGELDIEDVLDVDVEVKGETITPSQTKRVDVAPQPAQPVPARKPEPVATACEHGVPIKDACVECRAAQEVERGDASDDNPFQEGFFGG